MHACKSLKLALYAYHTEEKKTGNKKLGGGGLNGFNHSMSGPGDAQNTQGGAKRN